MKLNKLVALESILKKYDKICIALSGGCDSEFLLSRAVTAEVEVIAVTIVSPLFTQAELERAEDIARRFKVKHFVITYDPFAVVGFSQNPENRCYLCKKAMLNSIFECAAQQNCQVVMDGTNVDDTKDYRPGLQAAQERGVITPLKDVMLTKKEICALSKKLGLIGWNVPPTACLASRIPYGSEITQSKLSRIAAAELELRKLGFSRVRVRYREDGAVLELDDTRLVEKNMQKISDICKANGFNNIHEISTQARTMTVAAIEIGAALISLSIANVSPDGAVRIVETAQKPIEIGLQTFETGKLTSDLIDSICAILSGFSRLLADYGVDSHRVVATSAIREAKNCEFFLEQVRLRTNLTIDVISNAEERMLIFKCLSRNLPEFEKLKKDGVLIVQIGTGNVQLSTYVNGMLDFSGTVPVGAVRVSGMLSDILEKKLLGLEIIDEYIKSQTDRLKSFHDWGGLRGYIAVGTEDVAASYVKEHKATKSAIERAFTRVAKGYSRQRSALILLAIRRFFEFTEARSVLLPDVNLTDGVIYDLADKHKSGDKGAQYLKDAISAAIHLAKRFKCDEKHYQAVEKYATILFDNLLPLHGLTQTERVLLKMAAIMHECGKLVSITDGFRYSHSIIKATSFIGISERDLDIIANTAMHYTSETDPTSSKEFLAMPRAARTTCAKLIAILRIAETLDTSHNQKTEIDKIEILKGAVEINVKAQRDISLEQWAFSDECSFFGEVFGITPHLIVTLLV